MKMVLLQAGMAFGIILLEIAKALVFFGIPILTIILTLVSVNKNKSNGLPTKEIIRIIGRSLINSIITLIIVAVVVCFLLLFTGDFG